MTIPRFAVIIPAAGRSTRFGDGDDKLFATLCGAPVWQRAVAPFLNRGDVGQVIVAHARGKRRLFEAAPFALEVTFVNGGAERVDSIRAALRVLYEHCEFVAVHDAARPCASAELIERVFAAAVAHGAAIPGVPVADTIKEVDADRSVVRTVPRQSLVAVQTPQVMRRDWFVQAYEAAKGANVPTDDAQLLETLGLPCHVVEGSVHNLKITRREDLALAEAILRSAVSRP